MLFFTRHPTGTRLGLAPDEVLRVMPIDKDVSYILAMYQQVPYVVEGSYEEVCNKTRAPFDELVKGGWIYPHNTQPSIWKP